MADTKKQLILIITRAYAYRDASNDEWVADWGLDAKEDFLLSSEFFDETYKVLILHGCKENDYQKLLTRIKEKEQVGVFSKVLLCWHGLEKNDIKPLKDKITELFTSSTDIRDIQYTSILAGGPIQSLQKALCDLTDVPVPVRARLTTLSKNTKKLFLGTLHHAQSDLLALQFAMETLALGDTVEEEEHRKRVAYVVSSLGNIFVHEDGPFQRHLKFLDNLKRETNRSDFKRARDLFKVMAPPQKKSDEIILEEPDPNDDSPISDSLSGVDEQRDPLFLKPMSGLQFKVRGEMMEFPDVKDENIIKAVRHDLGLAARAFDILREAANRHGEPPRDKDSEQSSNGEGA